MTMTHGQDKSVRSEEGENKARGLQPHKTHKKWCNLKNFYLIVYKIYKGNIRSLNWNKSLEFHKSVQEEVWARAK